MDPHIPSRHPVLCLLAGINGGVRAFTVPTTTEVYVTDTGTKYHREGCPHLTHSRNAMSIAAAENAGYEPCSLCHSDTLTGKFSEPVVIDENDEDEARIDKSGRTLKEDLWTLAILVILILYATNVDLVDKSIDIILSYEKVRYCTSKQPCDAIVSLNRVLPDKFRISFEENIFFSKIFDRYSSCLLNRHMDIHFRVCSHYKNYFSITNRKCTKNLDKYFGRVSKQEMFFMQTFREFIEPILKRGFFETEPLYDYETKKLTFLGVTACKIYLGTLICHRAIGHTSEDWYIEETKKYIATATEATYEKSLGFAPNTGSTVSSTTGGTGSAENKKTG